MKLQALLLPVLLAAPAAAQVRVILPGGYNPYIGAPVTLPSPTVNYPAIMRIELPAPRLEPGLGVTFAPTPVAIAAVIPVLPMPMIPSRPIVPVIRPVATRENVSHPLAPILPGLNAQFNGARKTEKKNRRDELDEIFDGRSQPVRKPAVEPGATRPSRAVYLPERELEIEIGAY